MVIVDSHVETLEKLGLTQLQAKIYLATVTLQRATAIKIATTANVARPDVYRILPSLEELGLIRKLIATPTMYEATPLKEACQILVQKKKDEYSQVQKESAELIRHYAKKNNKQAPDIVDDSFSLIASKDLWIDKFVTATTDSQFSIETIGDWSSIIQMALNNTELYMNPLSKGVKIRLITDKPTDPCITEEWTTHSFPSLEIRFLDQRVPIKAMIFDRKTANMCVHSSQGNEFTPSLWSNNSEFVKVMIGYFENLWAKAKK